jgi:heat shock protein HslJ
MKLLVILSFIVSLKTCCESKTLAIQENNPTHLMEINGSYHVKTLNGNDVIEHKLTIDFNKETKSISGFSGCNRFTGNYTLESGIIKIGPIASTRMFCQESANQLEHDMQQALSKIDEVIIEDNMLQLLSNKKVLIVALKANENTPKTFNYSAHSRGTFFEITINDSIVSISKDRKGEPITKKCSKQEWNKLASLLNDIHLDSISGLKAPTEARFYDGASIGKLKIEMNNSTYESSSFDHGKPPKEIEALVKEILSLSENVE